MITEPYFSSRTGQRYTFRSVAEAIHEDHPHLDGKHIFVQLDAVNLRQDFDNGDTPYGLPYSFTDYLETDHA